jgi:hypothetical protein
MTDGRRPPRAQHRGPGDAHSAREWVWQRERYEALFADAPGGALTFESTPFYLWDLDSHARIARALPEVKLIAVIRDPVDRAFSNWSHLRADGLEPEADFLAACRAEPARAARGWAPFWRYLGLGRYGEQFEHLLRHVDRERVRVIRYRRLIEEPGRTLDELCRFLGVATGQVGRLPEANLGRWAGPGSMNTALRGVIRAGAAAGSYVDPRLWRRVERPLRSALQRGAVARPRLEREVRAQLVGQFADDNALLGELLGADYSDWLSVDSGGTYTVRRSWDPSGAAASK